MGSKPPYYNAPKANSEVENYVMQTLAKLETSIEGLRQELMGNGQPGRVQRIEGHCAELDAKVGRIKNRITYAAGIAVGVSAAIEIIVKLIR